MLDAAKTFAPVFSEPTPGDRATVRKTVGRDAVSQNLAVIGKASQRSTTGTRRKTKSRHPAAAQKILVVDDVADVTEMIALFLKHAGFEVTTANSADTALRLSSDSNFDLIISDIGMPEMNGYELARSLRERAAYTRTPMIAVTGYTEYDDRGRSLRSGFNAHLTKPINPAQLLKLIGELLN